MLERAGIERSSTKIKTMTKPHENGIDYWVIITQDSQWFDYA